MPHEDRHHSFCPSVEPEFRAEVESVLGEGETLSEFVEASVRASVERRRVRAEFIARGLRSRDEARLHGPVRRCRRRGRGPGSANSMLLVFG
jgi:hypothetical protein